jgi:prophage regulatory protein
MSNAASKPTRLIRKPEVLLRTGKSNTRLYAEIQSGKFPAPVKINADPSSRASGWIEEEVEAYIARRIEASRDQQAAA